MNTVKLKEDTNASQNNSSFVKEVAKYFMNFLETDFKKRRIPKRNTIQKTQKGLRVGVDLEKYPKLKKTFFALLNSGFKKENLQIKKGEYTNSVPKNLFDLIKVKIEKLSKKDLDNIFKKIEELVAEKAILYAKEYDKFLEETKEETKNIFSRNLIIPLIDDLDKPLENLNIADENSKFQLEIDIVDSVFALFEEKYSEVLQSFFQKQKDFDLKDTLQEIIKLPEIKNNLIKFFENFVIGDAFFDIYQLYRNNKLIDKTEIYLYFYELSLGNEKFPIFYIPITILKQEDKFTFQFEKRVFINTKAINFVVQEFNLQIQKQSTLAGEFDRILYITEEENFSSILKNIIQKIENFFELNKNIDIQNSELQKGMNLITSFSNKSYLYLFDKSDEALINDYEEILNDNGEILENFSSLLNGFIEENPKPFMEEVEDEWHEKSISQKLIFESPIPLNDEQKQVLIALQKPDCNFMILEGPPGTGKSHTITAIICKALLEEKSVLVLSDKKEALDVVEDKISETLNKIRHEDDFQNPILRLGKTGNKFYKIVQGQTIQKIKEHYNAYKYKKGEYDELRKNSFQELEKNIKENIDYFEGINIQDIEFYFQNIDKLSNINWINTSKESEIDLLKIKKGIQKLREHNDNLKINRELLDDKNYKLIKEYQGYLYALNESRENFKKDNPNVDINMLIEEFDKHVPYDNSMLNSLNSIKAILSELGDLYKDKPVILDLFRPQEELDLGVLIWRYNIINISLDLFFESRKFLGEKFNNYEIFSNFEIPKEIKPEEAIIELREYVNKVNTIRSSISGYLFKGKEIESITRNLKKTFNYFGVEKPQNNIKDIQHISDLFDFVYKKIPNDYRERGQNDNSIHSIFKILLDLLLNSNNEEHLSDYKRIQELQRKLVTIKEEIETIESSLMSINDLEYEIRQVNWNIDVFQRINNINVIIRGLSDIIPNNVELDSDESCGVFFTTDIIDNLDNLIKTIEKLRDLKNEIDFILSIKKKYSDFSKRIKLEISTENINRSSSVLSNYTDEEVLEYSKHKDLQSKLEKQFNNQPEDKFFDSISGIEDLITARMTYFLDKRIIEYTQDCANEVGTLKNIVRKKQKFPKDLFQNLKKAFPCILAGIRDYAEFIPLEKNLFDLIIIDEASQVSIAQALPALVRGKQIIVLGDDKQFSNVKANNASKVTNQELRKRVQDTFLKERLKGLDKNGWLTKVKENFDIKNSILKFSRFIRNYECQLKKHFRCYPEIISYSDKNFYNHTLQFMKIRGKPIDEVIKIEVIDHDGKFDETRNTNEFEIKHIIKKLKEFKEKEIEQSIGIITPHREQVTLLFDKISELPERDWLFGKCKLKIMTFDTCQGEERDYIFYSMVATKEKDRLNWIFLKDFSLISDEVDGTIKSQRMNVGFSRAKECIHFVLSKPIEEFHGEIKNALFHYKNELEIGKKRIFKKLDSKMEYKIDEIFHNTKFYKENKEKIEFIPQFEIGNYLRQLDRSYNHPAYKVDFLLIFNDQKIVIEYDGFKEHFVDQSEVNESNYKYYMKDDDIYRQKVLEGYGYKFLRINRFNIGDDPIETLNERLENLLKKNFKTE
ncbi:hypothetical protein KAT63_02115 [Candidatus Parcubacteria bacterium]|nr:hypothetical protein [Candidatus Parcubacteria bacterium]